MPLYSIKRVVGDVSQQEVDAAAYRAIICAYQFDDLKWHRSYWQADIGELTCLYEAQSPEQLQEHALQSRLPCDEVLEVKEIVPQAYIHG